MPEKTEKGEDKKNRHGGLSLSLCIKCWLLLQATRVYIY